LSEAEPETTTGMANAAYCRRGTVLSDPADHAFAPAPRPGGPDRRLPRRLGRDRLGTERRRLNRHRLPALVLGGLGVLGATPAAAIESALWVAFGIDLVGAVVSVSIWPAGRARLQSPDIEPWLEGERPAIESPPPGDYAARCPGRFRLVRPRL
jgi:hypothetical protein